MTTRAEPWALSKPGEPAGLSITMDAAACAALGFDLLTIDRRGRVVAAGETLRKRLGWAAAPLAPDLLRATIHPEDWHPLQNLLRRGQAGWLDLRLPDIAGAWIHYKALVLPQPAGKEVESDGEAAETFHLTLKEEREEARRRANIRLAEQAIKFGSWSIDRDRRSLQTTPGFAKLFDGEEQPATQPMEWIFAYLNAQNRRKLIADVFAGMKRRGPFSLQYWITRADGKSRLLHTDFMPETDARNRVTGLSGVTRDITDIAHITSDRIDAAVHGRLLADYANDVLCRFDVDGRCVFVSVAIETVLGYTPQEVIGGQLSTIVHDEDFHLFETAIKQWPRSQQPATVIFRARCKSGGYTWMEVVMRPLIDRLNGGFTGVVGIARDITHRKQVEEELREERRKADLANQAKSRFLANMSHELRTPLNAIIGFSEIMAEAIYGPHAHDKYGEYSRLIHDSGHHLLDLINDLLDMSKIEAGRQELFFEECHLSAIAESAAALVEPLAAVKNIDLSCRIAAGLPPLRADMRALKQILINLLSNAIKFTPAGGQVRLTVRQARDGFSIRIADTGIGIPAEALGRLGQPFEQAGSLANKDHKGTGLGLFLVKSLTRLHGGTFRIESEVGAGTTVEVVLPGGGAAAGTGAGNAA